MWHWRYLLKLFGPLVAWRARRRDVDALRVLVYHDVPAETLERFRQQMIRLQRYFYFVDPAAYIAGAVPKSRAGKMPLLLTLDDGFVSNRRAALDVLRPLGIRALFFIPSGYFNCDSLVEQESYLYERIYAGRYRRGDLPAGLAPMTWNDLKLLVKQGHVIGAHTVTHPRLGEMHDSAEIEKEVTDGGDELERRLDIKVDVFAIPFGQIGVISPVALATAGRRYKKVFTCVRGDNRNVSPWALRRECVESSEPPGYVLFQAAGGLANRYRIARQKLDTMAAEAEKLG